MKRALALTASIFLLSVAAFASERFAESPAAAKAAFSKEVVVDCTDSDSADSDSADSDSADRGPIAEALRKNRKVEKLTILLQGTCVESLDIERDNLTLQGLDDGAISGLVNVNGGANVVFRDFTIRDGDEQPLSGAIGGINALFGASVTIENMRVEDIANGRGIRLEGASALIVDTTVLNARGGAYVARTSDVTFRGNIEGSDSLFGMSLVTTKAFARDVDMTFNRNTQFGMVIQIDSSLEHVEGTLTANENRFGFVLAGQGSYAHGTQIELRENLFFGFFIDELSNLTPLIGAPGIGPTFTIVDNDNFGIFIDRTSVVQLTDPTVVTGNGIGLFVEASQLNVDGMTIEDNGTDATLGFGTKATFTGDNTFGTPIACDDTVLIRGADCEIDALTANSPASKRVAANEDLELLHGLMPSRLLR